MDNELIDLLRTISSGFQAQMKEQIALSDSGLSTFQARLINLIGRQDGISQQRLVALTERDKAQITRAIHGLETAGLIMRSPNQTDKRSKCLTLTPAGKEMHLHFKKIRQHLATETLSHLTLSEKQTLQTTLSKIANKP